MDYPAYQIFFRGEPEKLIRRVFLIHYVTFTHTKRNKKSKLHVQQTREDYESERKAHTFNAKN